MIDLDHYRVLPGTAARLAERPADDTQGTSRAEAEKNTRRNVEALRHLQERLYAEGRQSLLFVLQAMDTAGKDTTIGKVIGPLNPLGVRVWSFKAPTPQELSHDFLWRLHRRAPGAGFIGVFNRSHYEDVLIVRVRGLAPPEVVERRYGHINAFERLLHDEGTRIVKVMLHISKEYQLKRLKRRLKRPDRHWKFEPGDLRERERWEEYQAAYDLALTRCSTDYAPWHVVPSERRWFRDLVVSSLLRKTLEEMDPQYPAPSFNPADYPPDSLV
jgi:PPK2 family polyphosphate:nucleotide phosphotransferase